MVKTIFPETIVYRKEPANTVPTDNYLFSHEYQKVLPAVLLIEKRKLHFLPELFFFNCDLSVEKNLTPPRLLELPLRSRIKIFALNIFRPVKNVKQPCAIVIDDWSEGYFHWINDALPRLYLVCKNSPGRTILLPERFRQHDYILQSIKAFNVNVQFYASKNRYFLHDLVSVTLTAPTGNYREDLTGHVRKAILQIYAKDGISPLPAKIYLSRAKAQKRKVSNENELIEVLRKFDYRIIHFEDYSWLDQIRIVSRAKILISTHGGGLTNMLFLLEDSCVFELRRKEDMHNNCYFSMSSALNFFYFYQLCEGDDPGTFLANLTVNVEEFERNLRHMERTIQ